MSVKRIDVISDTHGRLSHDLIDALEGCDLIVHAGDMCSENDFYTLKTIAPIKMCLGNNDWSDQYGPEVGRLARFDYEGLNFLVSHYHEKLIGEHFDVGIFGHTHVPEAEMVSNGALVMNPGSPTFPRSEKGPTMGRIMVEDGSVLSYEIIRLSKQSEGSGWFGSFFGWK